MPLPNSRLLHPRFHQEVQGSAVGDRGVPDQGTIHRPTKGQPGVIGPGGTWTPPAGQLIYSGPLRIQADTTQDRTVDVGDRLVTLHAYRAGLPADAPQVLVDDVVTVTSSNDPHLARRPLLVRDVVYDTFLARRYLRLEDHPELPTPEV